MRVLGLDCSIAGISGDMLIASLGQYLSNYEEYIFNAIDIINIEIQSKLVLSFKEKSYDGFHGKILEIKGEKEKISNEELLDTFIKLSNKFRLKDNFKNFGLDIINLLIEVENEVHDEINMQLHEIGTLDTLVDTLIPSLLLQELNIEKIQISAVATGHGTAKTSHGILPIPTLATQILIEKGKILTIQGPVGEATTPTGAAIILSFLQNFPKATHVIWENHKFGFGTKLWSDRANVLRCRLGITTDQVTRISVLETNLDDISGEHLGNTVEELMTAGALDVSYYPIFMKKNRPAYCIRVVCENPKVTELAKLIMTLTGSLGIRINEVQRHIGDRKIIKVKMHILEFDKEIEFSVKHGVRKKIEFADLLKIAKSLQITPLEVEEVLSKYI